jgi:hypothetical protein
MSHKSRRKAERKLLVEALQSAEFPWDYSYFKWQDIPAEVRREMVSTRSMFGRTWIYGRTSVLMDVFKREARELYNQNWDGCRDCWKQNYQQEKEKAFAPEVKL